MEMYTLALMLIPLRRKWDTLNNSLRILSGLYGVLKDLMQPYRLEMGSFGVNGSKIPMCFGKENHCPTQ